MNTKRTVEAGKGGTTATKTGRPRINPDRPMSATERSRRRRAKPRPIKSSDEIFDALVAQRNLTSAFDRALATQITNSLVDGDLAEAVRALQHLPPIVRADPGSPTVSVSAARQKVLELLLNRISADRIERAARVEARDPTLTEREMLQFRIDQIDEQEASDQGEEGDKPDDEVATLRAQVAELRAKLAGALPPADDGPEWQ
jgi:hypothetical protein